MFFVGRPGPESSGSKSKTKVTIEEKKPVRIRKEFPETWLWADEKLKYVYMLLATVTFNARLILR